MRVVDNIAKMFMFIMLAVAIGCDHLPVEGDMSNLEESIVHEPVVSDPPSRIVDKIGRAWRRTRKVEYAAEPGPDATAVPAVPMPPSREPDLLALTDAELAEKIRPISLYAGFEYSLENPPIEEARKLKDHLRAQRRGEPLELYQGEPSEASAGVPEEEEISAQIIIDTDNRSNRRDNLDFPWRTMLWITDSSQSSYCTAQLIGPSTATSVAHCFHNGSNWYSTRRWATGVDGQDANPFPDGRFDGCYWVTIPAAWDGSGIYYDFAVIEFSDMYPTCNLRPGDWAGWLGWKSNYVPSSSEYGYVYGFPFSGCPGAQTCNRPQIWGIGANQLDEDGDNIDHYADTSGGQSGAVLYVIDGAGNRYLIGNHKGGYSNPFDDWNEARRLEGLFYSFLKDYSAL